jgi:hypothetical protein
VIVISAAWAFSLLYRSVDGGRRWGTTRVFEDGGAGFNDLGFTTDLQGIVIRGFPGRPGPHQLLITHNAGATWRQVSLG